MNAFDILLTFVCIGMALRLGWSIGTAMVDTANDISAERRERRR
ncbi:hypothetical protein [Salipiger thiooxidans]|nr:hypothetical protein [Salipiger thiooxidans]